MAQAIVIDCGFSGCTTKGEMNSMEEAHHNVGLHKLTQLTSKSVEPTGWAYVQIHKAIRRAFCPAHKTLAAKQEQEKRAEEVRAKEAALAVYTTKTKRGVRRGR